MPWESDISAGDIVIWMPKKPTFFGSLVRYFSHPTNDAVHVAMVYPKGSAQPEHSETELRVIDIEFGRRVSTYFVPRKYGEIKIFRLFNTEQFCSFVDGTANFAFSQDIAKAATEIAYENASRARYSLSECFKALETQKKRDLNQVITAEYIQWLESQNNNPQFMCVSFVLSCYQRACIKLLGGIPQAFVVQAHSTPSDLVEYIQTSPHFCCRPPELIEQILITGDPVYRPPSSHSRFSWFWRPWGRNGYQPLIPGPEEEEESLSSDSEDNAAGLGI